jgi:hypothetical protein
MSGAVTPRGSANAGFERWKGGFTSSWASRADPCPRPHVSSNMTYRLLHIKKYNPAHSCHNTGDQIPFALINNNKQYIYMFALMAAVMMMSLWSFLRCE